MKALLALALFSLNACVSSPLTEMMRANARGEVACVRNDVLQKENCR